ncbi:MAG TPA: short-chain dehydrogenase, partial [Pseudomonadota bacterium]|nr:short-chain dehydrogenase [Pseudomonadota bacterium]
ELSRRLGAAGSAVRATAAHPGWTATDLQRTAGAVRFLNPIFAMKPEGGAMPTIRAAVDPPAQSGTYWGPAGLFEMNGPPARARLSRSARDAAVAARLWTTSETLTGIHYGLPAGAAA